MATDPNHFRALMEKLNKLPPERVAEVEDFVDYLRLKDQDHALAMTAAKVSEPSFAKVWDNPDDAAYDAL
ncbi:MAG: toxin-antitoxin system, antitoxin component, Xre family protein [Gammaproteobacteria bacterium]|nr:MAG: toxin-antitoxin system, antitoxin component, Xre family protein [Gammaproteobacteria bacterium]